MKEYIFENDYYRGSILVETGGFYDYSNYDKFVYEITEKATFDELKKVERLGDGIIASFYVTFLNLKHK